MARLRFAPWFSPEADTARSVFYRYLSSRPPTWRPNGRLRAIMDAYARDAHRAVAHFVTPPLSAARKAELARFTRLVEQADARRAAVTIAVTPKDGLRNFSEGAKALARSDG